MTIMAKRPNYTEFLLTTKSAYFFQKQNSLSRALVERIFHSAMRNATGNAVQRRIQNTVQVGGANVTYSFLLSVEESEPAFLDGTALRNVEHCFLLLCELPSTIAVFKSHAQFTESDL